jgi:tetratricopeptide (TPR) repeat protein
MTNAENKYDVFISYSHHNDLIAVERIADILKRNQLAVWLDRWRLVPGERWKDSIKDAIRNSSTILLIVGASFPDSQHQELQFALHYQGQDYQKRIVPILLPGSDYKNLPSSLLRYQSLDLRDQKKEKQQITRLIASLSKSTEAPILREITIGDDLLSTGDFLGALASFKKALELANIEYSPDHPAVLDLLNKVGNCLVELGDLLEAENVFHRALELAESIGDKLKYSSTLSNIASLCRDQGRYEDAMNFLQKSLEIDRVILGPNDPIIANRLNNYASLLRDIGRSEEALDYYKKALTIDEQNYEPGHPTISTRLNNIALVLMDLGELEKARDLLRKALASDQNTFGSGHPSIATRQSNLAMVLKDLGELEEARDLLRMALASDQNTFGSEHPAISTDRSNLAMVLKELGELEEARDLLRQALASDQNTFSPSHPSIATRQANLSLVLKELGEFREAKDLLEMAIKTFNDIFGAEHPYTKISKNNLETM